MNTETTTTNTYRPNVDIGKGDFEYIKDKHTRDLCINAFHAITLCEAWDFMAQYCESYMRSNSPYIHKITLKMETCPPYENGGPGHSGASFGIVMREMQFLAIYGVKAHMLKYREPTVPL